MSPAAFVLSLVVIAAVPSGNAVVRGRAGPSDIVVTTTARLAGAIDSVTWNGQEFIDSADHGRQLQSAATFDCGEKLFHPETFNPTEAGSVADGAGPTSKSRLLELTATGNALHTVTRMAFWLPPGGTSAGHPAKNTVPLSDHRLTKTVTVGVKGFPHAIDYRVTFAVPATDPKHTLAQFEALTGYMPPAFGTFQAFDPKTGTLAPLTDGPGEQAKPVVFGTADGKHAMGVWSPDAGASYGRFRFVPEMVVKWNCVFRVRDANGVTPGDYSYRMFVAVGTTEDVRATLTGLIRESGGRR